MNLADTILLSLVASLLSLDQVACFQMLLSRPILTALVLGALFGDVTEAVMVGLCFELLFCRAIPFTGRAADPTLAVAAVLGGMWGLSPEIYGQAIVSIHPLAAAPFAGALGLLASFISKWFDLRLRDVNTALFHKFHRVGYVQLTALLALFVKSFAFYLLAIWAVQGALPRILILLGPSATAAAFFAWIAVIASCLAYTTSTFFQSSTGLTWAVGVVVGCVELAVGVRLGMSALALSLCTACVFIVVLIMETVRYRPKGTASE